MFKINLKILSLIIFILLVTALPVSATVYIYDDLNRLTTVTLDNGQIFNYTYDAAGNLLSVTSEENQAIQAVISCNPNVLNSKSNGKWIVSYIELPVGYDVSQIDLSSIKLNQQISAITDPTYGFVSNPEIEDRDGNGLAEMMVKFDRAAVQQTLQTGDNTITIKGNVIYDGETLGFEGTTNITVNQ